MAGEANLDELAKQLDQSLSLGDQHASTTVTVAAAGLEGISDSSVPEKRSDVESLYSVPSAVGSLSSIDEDIDNKAATAVQVPLTAYMPKLPKKATSLFAAAASPVHHIAHMIKNGAAKRIIVMAGAGISTDAGIPDFRSPETGLYANLQQYRLPYPEAIFTIDYFKRKPKPFFVLAKELYPGQFIPTISHFFVKLLAQKNLLLRHYTQNIDCLERMAGIESALIVEAHGSFHSAHCISAKCRKEHAQDWVKEQIFSDKVPHCTQCKSLVKPDITFFGEGLPQRFFELLDADFDVCDLLIVMGTSLQVHPFASLIDQVPRSTPRLLVNRERVGESSIGGIGFDFDGKHVRNTLHRDALILGDCDEACLLLADHLGWKEELLKLRAEFVAKHKLNGT
ncbi:hypothetical protein LPJ78_002342 [Coemansia sp. RSA 989]|nr:hypothetical protein LPJ68_001629 [Coemansia sp. RSA 1086]KAJ1865847.1 hypothetical protein LPJ78_002342 [Coemansia sp. RSA 989]KAJ1873099.1 hypothetical protein LPJ55_002565 [Coemansia sp. RSA 990]KAJ2669874.1 hypothetical protein IWW42_004328 [Coemansia sp. RSA 1085]